MRADMHPVLFGPYFQYFQTYWNLCQQKGRYNPIELFILTMKNFSLLQSVWAENKWDINELVWICAKIENGKELLNPNNFIMQDYAYAIHAKNCIYLNGSQVFLCI